MGCLRLRSTSLGYPQGRHVSRGGAGIQQSGLQARRQLPSLRAIKHELGISFNSNPSNKFQ